MLDRWVTATNKINAQSTVIFMFCLGTVIALWAAHMHNLSDKAQIELFGLASALVTGGLGMLNGNKGSQNDLPPGSNLHLSQQSDVQVPPIPKS